MLPLHFRLMLWINESAVFKNLINRFKCEFNSLRPIEKVHGELVNEQVAVRSLAEHSVYLFQLFFEESFRQHVDGLSDCYWQVLHHVLLGPMEPCQNANVILVKFVNKLLACLI